MDVQGQLECMRECYQPGCNYPAMPDREMKTLGTDHMGMAVYGYRWHCAGLHFYDVPLEGWAE